MKYKSLDDIELPELRIEIKPKPKHKRKYKPPSIDHSTLQLFGQKWLYDYGCRYAATEVANVYAVKEFWDLEEDLREISSQPNSSNKPRYVYDVLGIRRNNGRDEIIGIEVKVSREDLAKGFCLAGCHRNFILVPEELLSALKVPSWVGVLYFNGKEVECKRGARYRKTNADPDYLKREILERNSVQIRFSFLSCVLEKILEK